MSKLDLLKVQLFVYDDVTVITSGIFCKQKNSLI